MAIKPSECIALTGAEQKELAQLESAVDLQLKKHYQGAGHVVFFEVPDSATTRVLQRLITRYKDVGWRVEEGSGQQLSCLKFSE